MISMIEVSSKSNYKNKLSFLRISRFALIMMFSFFVLFYIGLNSDYLIKNIIKYICLALCIGSLILFIVFLVKYFKSKGIKLKKRRHIMNFLVSVYSICCIGFLVLLYGPYNGFREWLITTAMGTMTHHYLCEMFYNENTIKEVQNSNYIEDNGEETDDTLLAEVQEVIKDETKWTKYEKQLFNKHTADEIYRKIEFKVRIFL